MRQAEIYRKGILAGILTEDGGEYLFCYDKSYLNPTLIYELIEPTKIQKHKTNISQTNCLNLQTIIYTRSTIH